MKRTRRGAMGLFAGAALGTASIGAAARTAQDDTETTRQEDDRRIDARWHTSLDTLSHFESVIPGGDGYVAVGYEELAGAERGSYYEGVARGVAPDGSIRWSHRIADDEDDYFCNDATRIDGESVVVGGRRWRDDDANYHYDGLVLRLADDGTERERVTFEGYEQNSILAAAPLATGEVATLANAPFENESTPALLRIVDPDGGAVSQTTWIDVEQADGYGESVEYPIGIASAGSGALALVGASSWAPEDDDAPSSTTRRGVLVRIDENGAEQWRREIAPERHEWFHGIVSVEDGFLAVGRTTDEHARTTDEADGLVVALDEEGAVKWRQVHSEGSSLEYNDAAEFADSYAVVGTKESEDGDRQGTAVACAPGDGSIEDDAAFGSDTERLTAAVEATDRGIVAAGAHYGGPGTFRNLAMNVPPEAAVEVPTESPTAGETVTLDAGASTDDSGIERYEWDLDGDGEFEASGETVETNFTEAGEHEVALRVADEGNASAGATHNVTVAEAEDGGDALPGFGVAAAIAGLAGGALWRRRDRDAE